MQRSASATTIWFPPNTTSVTAFEFAQPVQKHSAPHPSDTAPKGRRQRRRGDLRVLLAEFVFSNQHCNEGGRRTFDDDHFLPHSSNWHFLDVAGPSELLGSELLDARYYFSI